jgi:hypothetical protein
MSESQQGPTGFHTAEAALGLVMLTCGPITLTLPYEKAKIRSG